MKFNAEGREGGRGSWEGDSKLEGLGEGCKLLQRSLGRSPDHLDALRAKKSCPGGRKMCLVAVSRFYSVETLDATDGNLVFRGTLVEKHWGTHNAASNPRSVGRGIPLIIRHSV